MASFTRVHSRHFQGVVSPVKFASFDFLTCMYPPCALFLYAHSASTTSTDLANSSFPDGSSLIATGNQKRVSTLKSPADRSVSLVAIYLHAKKMP